MDPKDMHPKDAVMHYFREEVEQQKGRPTYVGFLAAAWVRAMTRVYGDDPLQLRG